MGVGIVRMVERRRVTERSERSIWDCERRDNLTLTDRLTQSLTMLMTVSAAGSQGAAVAVV